MIRNLLLLSFGLLTMMHLDAQNYTAIQGSLYAGSLGVHNNPASNLMSPFKWDVTIFGFQAKSSTNLFTIYNYSLLSNPAKSQYQFNNGERKRFASISLNLNLLNARIALNRRSAVAFGINIRSVSNLNTSSYNFEDTLKTSGDFFKINNPGNTYTGKITSASWAEIYASYAHTFIDDEGKRINAGITLKVNKGLSGARAELTDGNFLPASNNRYDVTSSNLGYRYSSNFDYWQKSNNTSTNIRQFLQYTSGGISFDAGLEYVVKPNVVKFADDDDDYYDYEWKIGVSLLDAGFTQYRVGSQSRNASGINSGTNNVQLDTKFDSTITSAAIFNDSLATIVNTFTGVAGGFKIINPMRIVVNVDRFIYHHFYVNAEISLNVPSSFLKKWYTVREMNLITVTPRWETTKFGLYLPIQVTNTNRFWIGGAFKAGPLLFGVHNLANIIAKNTLQNGGGYIALIIHNFGAIARRFDRRLDCPAL